MDSAVQGGGERLGSAQFIPGFSEQGANRLFGELLVSKGLLTEDDLADGLNAQRQEGGRLGEILLRLNLLGDTDITHALAEHLAMEYVSLEDINKVDVNLARSLPESIAKRFCLVAYGEDDNKTLVAMADPLDVIAIDTVTLKMKRQVKASISSPREIRRAIGLIYHGSDIEEQQLRDLVDVEVSAEIESDDALLEDINNGIYKWSGYILCSNMFLNGQCAMGASCSCIHSTVLELESRITTQKKAEKLDFELEALDKRVENIALAIDAHARDSLAHISEYIEKEAQWFKKNVEKDIEDCKKIFEDVRSRAKPQTEPQPVAEKRTHDQIEKDVDAFLAEIDYGEHKKLCV